MSDDRRTAAAARPLVRARSTHQASATAVEYWPKPPPASNSAVTAVSRSTLGTADATSVPAAVSAAYSGRRATPCASWPERLARTRWAATSAATSPGAPMAAQTPLPDHHRTHVVGAYTETPRRGPVFMRPSVDNVSTMH